MNIIKVNDILNDIKSSGNLLDDVL
jgi:hypothetical protein